MDVYHNPRYAEVRDSLHTELSKLMAKYQDSDSLAMKYVQQTIDNPPNLYWLNIPASGGQGSSANRSNTQNSPVRLTP